MSQPIIVALNSKLHRIRRASGSATAAALMLVVLLLLVGVTEILYLSALSRFDEWGLSQLRIAIFCMAWSALYFLGILALNRAIMRRPIKAYAMSIAEMARALPRSQRTLTRGTTFFVTGCFMAAMVALYFWAVASNVSQQALLLLQPIPLLLFALLLAGIRRSYARGGGANFTLYLRGFPLDSLDAASPSKVYRWAAWMPSFFIMRHFATVESIIFSAVGRSADRAVAVGEPGKLLPRAGFPRKKFLHSEWQSGVTEYLADCTIVIMGVHASPGATWELKQIAHMGLQSKSILVFFPVDAAAHRAAVLAASELVGGGFAPLGEHVAPDDMQLLAAFVSKGGTLTCVYGLKGDRASYHEAIALGTFAISTA